MKMERKEEKEAVEERRRIRGLIPNKKRKRFTGEAMKEHVKRRKTEGGKGKCQRRSQAGGPRCGWRREARVPIVAPPSPFLLYFSSSTVPNNFLLPSVMFLTGNRAHTHTNWTNYP